MHKIDSDTATAANEFTAGDPGPPEVPPTEVTEAWLNAVQKELVNLVELMGLTLAKTDNSQVFQALMTMKGYYVCTDGGSANDYELTPSPLSTPNAYYNGMTVVFKPANANTGASTLEVGSLGAVDLVDASGNALTGGELTAGEWVAAWYNAADGQFELTELYQAKKTDIFVNNPNGKPTISDDVLNICSDLTSASYETVGATGSGADFEWPALDNLPPDIDWIEITMAGQHYVTSASGSAHAYITVNSMKYDSSGSSYNIGWNNMIYSARAAANSSGVADAGPLITKKIQIEKPSTGGPLFMLYYVYSVFASNNIYTYLTGAGYNKK